MIQSSNFFNCKMFWLHFSKQLTSMKSHSLVCWNLLLFKWKRWKRKQWDLVICIQIPSQNLLNHNLYYFSNWLVYLISVIDGRLYHSFYTEGVACLYIPLTNRDLMFTINILKSQKTSLYNIKTIWKEKKKQNSSIILGTRW